MPTNEFLKEPMSITDGAQSTQLNLSWVCLPDSQASALYHGPCRVVYPRAEAGGPREAGPGAGAVEATGAAPRAVAGGLSHEGAQVQELPLLFPDRDEILQPREGGC